MNVVTIIQSRMGSTRLPGKVLLDLAGEPMLTRIVNRVQRAETVNSIVIATTPSQADESILHLCTLKNWHCFRGSENDVLDRYYQAAKKHHADVIVRITADCPLIEPTVIDQVVQSFLECQPEVDYASNILSPRTFPRGLDTEVFSFAALEKTWQQAMGDPGWREHVTSYIYSHPDQFHLRRFTSQVDYSHLRWTVDTPEDLAFVRNVYEYFRNDEFSWRDVLSLLELHPEWLEINRHIEQKAV
jgi:spore coat polysaccharide biosynthesis protein SpsF